MIHYRIFCAVCGWFVTSYRHWTPDPMRVVRLTCIICPACLPLPKSASWFECDIGEAGA